MYFWSSFQEVNVPPLSDNSIDLFLVRIREFQLGLLLVVWYSVSIRTPATLTFSEELQNCSPVYLGHLVKVLCITELFTEFLYLMCFTEVRPRSNFRAFLPLRSEVPASPTAKEFLWLPVVLKNFGCRRSCYFKWPFSVCNNFTNILLCRLTFSWMWKPTV